MHAFKSQTRSCVQTTEILNFLAGSVDEIEEVLFIPT